MPQQGCCCPFCSWENRGEVICPGSHRISWGRDQVGRPCTAPWKAHLGPAVCGQSLGPRGEPHRALPLPGLMGELKPAEMSDSNTDGDKVKF